MSVQIGWKVDVNACHSCRGCETSCKVEYNIKAGQGRRRRVIEKTTNESGTIRTFFLSLACNQCEKPACIAACPVSQSVGVGTAIDSALWKDVTGGTSGGVVGVVRVEPSKCIGCRRCEWACPYGAPQFDPDSRKIHKCEMCWQRIANTQLHPSRRVGACVATCLGQSIKQDWVETSDTGHPEWRPDHTRQDTDDYSEGPLSGNGLLDGDETTGSQVYVGTGLFAEPGATGVTPPYDRGTQYVANYAMTLPALKIRNRVYVNRTGSGVV